MNKVAFNLFVVLTFMSFSSSFLAAKTSKQIPALTEEQSRHIKPIMHTFIAPISGLLTEFTHEEQNQKTEVLKENVYELHKNLKKLKTRANLIGTDYSFLADSLFEDVNSAKSLIDKNDKKGLKFVVLSMTEHCVRCHTKLDSKNDFSNNSQMLPKAVLQNHDFVSQIDMFITLRQFDNAIDLIEKKLFDESVKSTVFSILNVFSRYFELNLKVKSDLDRPQKYLAKYLKERKEITEYQKKYVEFWMMSLADLQKQNMMGHLQDFDFAVKIFDKGEAEYKKSFGQEGLVYMIASSIIFEKKSLEGNKNSEERAKSYLYLGRISSQIDRSYWISENENYFESAILTSPHSPIAKEAYGLLKQSIYFGFSGSSGVHIPLDQKKKLERLEKYL